MKLLQNMSASSSLSYLPLLLLVLLASSPISAHTLFTNILVDGIDQGLGTCMRMPLYPNNATFPQPDITAPSMTCGFNGNTAVARTCPVQPGSTLTLQFRDHPDASAPGSIDPSHKGPCAAYLKKVDDATKNGTGSTNGASSDGWFRIFYSDYDQTAGKWCTETLIENNGLLSVKMPQTLPAGDYLLRGELLALHQADKTPPDPQFYIGCAQIWMNGSAASEPTPGDGTTQVKTELPSAADTVAIPGYVNLSMPAMTFNIWQTPMKLPYPGYGPPVYQDTAAPASASSSATTQKKRNVAPSQPQQTSGLRPASCILAVANWCGTEVAAYSTQQGCWNASTACYGQEDACWRAAGPTGGAGCRLWENKCKQIQDGCKAGNYNGPPDQGKRLDQVAQKVQVPAVGGMFGVQRVGGVVGAGGSSGDGNSMNISSASAPAVAGYSSVAATTPTSVSAPDYSQPSLASAGTSGGGNVVPASSIAAPASSLAPTTLTVIAIPLTSPSGYSASPASVSVPPASSYSASAPSSSPSHNPETATATTPSSTAKVESYEPETGKDSPLDQSSHNDHDHDHGNNASSSSSSPTSSPSSVATSWDTNAQFLAAAEILSEAYGSTGSGPSPFSLLGSGDTSDTGSDSGGGGGRRHGRSWGGSLGRCGPAAAGGSGSSGNGSGKSNGEASEEAKCAIRLCCSQFGFCGTGEGYCGSGCLHDFGVCA